MSEEVGSGKMGCFKESAHKECIENPNEYYLEQEENEWFKIKIST